MKDYAKFYIDGEWVESATPHRQELIDPTTEEVFATVAMATVEEVDTAVAAARRAFKKLLAVFPR
ncbi:aldehyde dehydrogenase family protein [Pseudomonas lini]